MTPLHQRTPMRTPKREADVLLTEAQNLVALTTQQTPLMGEDNVSLHPSDFSGITPARRAAATPNAMHDALTTPGGSSVHGSVHGSTRGGSVRGSIRGIKTPAGAGATPTPMRDGLRINDELGEDLQARALREQVASDLGELPAPKNQYKIMAPEDEMAEEQKEARGLPPHPPARRTHGNSRDERHGLLLPPACA